MSTVPEPVIILPAEFVGHARHDDQGVLRIGQPGSDGTGVVEISLAKGSSPGWWADKTVGVYVRRSSADLSVIEIHIARHDGLAQEELDHQNEEAERYPLGAKEYWRSEMVGKCSMGSTGRLMTDDDFEIEWGEDY